MAKRKSKSVIYTVGEGGPMYLDLVVNVSEIEVWVNRPGMQISKLVLVTSLTHASGYNADSLRCLAECLAITSHCGHVGIEDVTTAIRFQAQSPQLEVGVGSTGMYQNRVRICTVSGQPLSKVLREHLSPLSRASFLAGLVPVQMTDEGHGRMSSGGGVVVAMAVNRG